MFTVEKSEVPKSASPDFSQKISLLRFPLTVLIVLIHARFQGPEYPDAATHFLSNSVLFGKLPHCAVAMFFAISGYLIPTQVDHGFFNLLKRKLKSLALPYLLWNSLLMLPHLLLPLVAGNSSLLPAAKYENLSVWQSIVRTYGLNLEPPIDVPLWFIRNLLLLSLTAPILLWLMRRVPTWLSLGVLFLGSYLTVDCSLWFFAFGMLFRIAKIDHLKFNRLTPPFIAIPILYCIISEFHGFNWPLLLWLSLFLFLGMASLAQKLPSECQTALVRLGECSFWIYCLHAPFATTFTRLGQKLHFLHLPPTAWVFLNCLITIAFCILSLLVLQRLSPRLTSILAGGRIPQHSPRELFRHRPTSNPS